MSLAALACLLTVCVGAGLLSVRVRHARAALALGGVSLVVAAVSLALLAADVMGVPHPDPLLALSFFVLSSAGGGLLFGEVNHLTRRFSGATAFGVLFGASSTGLTVYLLAV
ncbi:MAG: hypothetical protein H6719_20010 [Sandaracinaceae bacterium]|nr:hypothetical protein [Sandaracinaceae bacterium]